MTKTHDETESTIVQQQQTTLLDELSLRLSQTQQELVKKKETIHYKDANSIVNNHVLISTTIGIVPLPLFDIIALSGTQLNMLHHLSRHYKIAFDKTKGRVLILSLLSGSLPVATVMGASSLFKIIPGVGTFAGNAGVSLLGGSLTYATGQTFIKHFNAGGNLVDFSPKQFSHFFRQELKKGKMLLLRQSA